VNELLVHMSRLNFFYLDSFSHKGHHIDFKAYEYSATTEAHNFTI